MLSTYLQIARHLFDSMPQINWIDRDKGQIDNEGEFHSLVDPAILLDFGEIAWTGTGRGYQLGELTVTTKLVFVKPAETFTRDRSPLQEYAQYNALADFLHETISELKDIKERRRSADYFTKNWYVVEQVYDLNVTYEKPVQTVKKPLPNIEGALSTTLNIQQ